MKQVTVTFRRVALVVLGIVIVSYVAYAVYLNRSRNIFDALQNHHDTMRSLGRKTTDDKQMFWKLRNHLRVHHASEQELLYDVLSTKESPRRDVLKAIEEHYIIDLLLQELEMISKDDERWATRFEVLWEYIERHFTEEETGIFPETRQLLTEQEMKEMGRRFVRDRKRYL